MDVRGVSGEQDTPRAVVISHAVVHSEASAPDNLVDPGRAALRTPAVQELLHVGDAWVLGRIVHCRHHPVASARQRRHHHEAFGRSGFF